MWLEEVERRLTARPVRRRSPEEGLTRAAVLVPVYVNLGELWLLLTRRAKALPHHAGQMAFPGGACEEADEDEIDTALREAHEELGLEPATVMVLGQLDDVWTPSGFVISPVVGALPFPLKITPSDDEIESVVQIPFRTLTNPQLVEFQDLLVDGEVIRSPMFHYHGDRVWGATARVIADLVGRLTGTEPVWAE
ncbi:MAG: NUDIX hydrolase [Thermoanaerobaculales bacterium]